MVFRVPLYDNSFRPYRSVALARSGFSLGSGYPFRPISPPQSRSSPYPLGYRCLRSYHLGQRCLPCSRLPCLATALLSSRFLTPFDSDFSKWLLGNSTDSLCRRVHISHGRGTAYRHGGLLRKDTILPQPSSFSPPLSNLDNVNPHAFGADHGCFPYFRVSVPNFATALEATRALDERSVFHYSSSPFFTNLNAPSTLVKSS